MNVHSPVKRASFAVLAIAYICGWIVLAFLGVKLWNTYCEGFGCTGIGIAWFAWSGAYAIALLLGFLASRTQHGIFGRVMRYVLVTQIAAGVWLLGYWAVHAVA